MDSDKGKCALAGKVGNSKQNTDPGRAADGNHNGLGHALRELTVKSALESLLDSLLASASGRLGCGGGLVGLLDPDMGIITIRTQLGFGRAIEGAEFSAEQPVIQQVLHGDAPVFQSDVNALGSGYPGWEPTPLGAFVAVRVTCMGNPLGILLLASEGSRQFDPRDADALTPIAHLIALAVQRSQLEDRLEEAQELAEVASRAKTAFLANMSHELRTPLTSILGYAELLGEPDFGPLSDTQAGFAKVIGDSGNYLLQLINNLLDLASIETGKMRLEPSQFALPELLQGCLEMIRSRAAKHSVKLHLAVGDVGTIVADEPKVKQIVYHLLTNACKFTPDGGSVRLSAEGDPRGVTVVVEDTGVGVPEKQREAVFREFYRVESATTADNSGAGLGLALAKRFVQLHHGRIWIESRPGIGSRVSFTIPAALSNGVRPVSGDEGKLVPADPGTPIKPAVVLVIEDNPANIGLICQMLGLVGCEAIASTRGIEGIEKAKKLQPDMILLDIQLPDIDGLTVLRVLKADPTTNSIPVVAVTAYAMKGDRERMLAAGCDGYISKPIDMKVLRNTVGELLQAVE